jgi:hypothetical protein
LITCSTLQINTLLLLLLPQVSARLHACWQQAAHFNYRPTAAAAASAAAGCGKAFMNTGKKQWGIGYMQHIPTQHPAAAASAAASAASDAAGFGKAFMNAGNKQWGVGYMQHDLSDSVAWAVAKGIADPAKVCIMGGSYGGLKP